MKQKPIYRHIVYHFMKVSTENDNNFGYEKITILVDFAFKITDK